MCNYNRHDEGAIMIGDNLKHAREVAQREGVTIRDVLMSDMLDEMREIKAIVKRRDGWMQKFWAALSAGVGEFFAGMRSKD